MVLRAVLFFSLIAQAKLIFRWIDFSCSYRDESRIQLSH